jgi:hypothetical protein
LNWFVTAGDTGAVYRSSGSNEVTPRWVALRCSAGASRQSQFSPIPPKRLRQA